MTPLGYMEHNGFLSFKKVFIERSHKKIGISWHFKFLYHRKKKQFLPEFSDADGCRPPARSRQPYNFHPSFETHKNCLLQMWIPNGKNPIDNKIILDLHFHVELY